MVQVTMIRAKMIRTTAKQIITAGALSTLALSVLISAASAQGRGDPPARVPGTNAPAGTPSGAGTPGAGSRGGSDGLPDAVTVLDILRRLPDGPGRGGDDNYGPDDTRPVPQNETPSIPPVRIIPPKRVVVIPIDTPFVPRPSPRPQASPPPIVGSIGPQIRDREVLVTLGAGSDTNTVYELSQDLGLDGETLYTSALLGVRIARFRIPDTRSVADVLQQLATDVRVTAAQPGYVYTASQTAAKPAALPVPQYAPAKLRLDEAHKIAKGKRIRIAVIDTAVDGAHPALVGAVAESYDALGETKPVAELHGTAIAGIVAARAELIGVAPAADVLGIRAFTAGKNGVAQSHTLALLRAVDWAAMNGARVINMSFAGPSDPLLGKAIEAAVKKDITVVAAAGNGGPDAKPAYPAAYPFVIAVTATDNADATFKQANRGDYIAVAAPGVDIIATAPNGAYDISSGTSMAAAHVTGIAALMIERDPKLKPADIAKKIAASARKRRGAPAKEIGAGIADAAGALKSGK